MFFAIAYSSPFCVALHWHWCHFVYTLHSKAEYIQKLLKMGPILLFAGPFCSFLNFDPYFGLFRSSIPVTVINSFVLYLKFRPCIIAHFPHFSCSHPVIRPSGQSRKGHPLRCTLSGGSTPSSSKTVILVSRSLSWLCAQSSWSSWWKRKWRTPKGNVLRTFSPSTLWNSPY